MMLLKNKIKPFKIIKLNKNDRLTFKRIVFIHLYIAFI